MAGIRREDACDNEDEEMENMGSTEMEGCRETALGPKGIRTATAALAEDCGTKRADFSAVRQGVDNKESTIEAAEASQSVKEASSMEDIRQEAEVGDETESLENPKIPGPRLETSGAEHIGQTQEKDGSRTQGELGDEVLPRDGVGGLAMANHSGGNQGVCLISGNWSYIAMFSYNIFIIIDFITIDIMIIIITSIIIIITSSSQERKACNQADPTCPCSRQIRRYCIPGIPRKTLQQSATRRRSCRCSARRRWSWSTRRKRTRPRGQALVTRRL